MSDSEDKCDNKSLKNLFSLVNLKERIVEFLQSSTNFFQELEQNCIYFNSKFVEEKQENLFRPFCVGNLKLNFDDLKDSDLFHFLFKETLHFEILLREVIYCAVKAICKKFGFDFPLDLEQVHCTILFSDITEIKEYLFDPRSVHINIGLSVFHCVVFSVGPPEKFIRQTVWSCTEKCCNTIGAPAKKVPKCPKCSKDCVEQDKFRDLVDYCLIQVFPVNSFKPSQNNSLNRCITLKVLDNLTKELKLGHEYLVIGRFDPTSNYYIVWNVKSL